MGQPEYHKTQQRKIEGKANIEAFRRYRGRKVSDEEARAAVEQLNEIYGFK